MDSPNFPEMEPYPKRLWPILYLAAHRKRWRISSELLSKRECSGHPETANISAASRASDSWDLRPASLIRRLSDGIYLILRATTACH